MKNMKQIVLLLENIIVFQMIWFSVLRTLIGQFLEIVSPENLFSWPNQQSTQQLAVVSVWKKKRIIRAKSYLGFTIEMPKAYLRLCIGGEKRAKSHSFHGLASD